MASDGDSGGAAPARRDLVCVTGGSGFAGSWLVRLLLDRGYTVHTTVKNLDEAETKHLQALGGTNTRLQLFQMDLLDPASVRPAVEGARGNEFLEPAVKSTLNVLRAVKDCGVGHVVLMSSPAVMVVDEDCWVDVELLKKVQFWYSVSKTLAEKAAWDFAARRDCRWLCLIQGWYWVQY
uniref:NAD-dependent epimerase/dehydratase domain-containing protein n=1 Tax=Setaria italica TaxID=4555 RepID=K3XMF9_SETIT